MLTVFPLVDIVPTALPPLHNDEDLNICQEAESEQRGDLKL